MSQPSCGLGAVGANRDSPLGIPIDPSEVRLLTRVEDPYSWKYPPARTHLFEKNLSKDSIGAYMELCREVGISFEAAAKENLPFTGPEAKFTDRIAELEAENSRLIGEVNKSKDTVTAVKFKRDAEEAANQVTNGAAYSRIRKPAPKEGCSKMGYYSRRFRVCTADSH